MPPETPIEIARARIAAEAERRTGILDLSNLGLEELPEELFALTHLREIDLAGRARWADNVRPNRIDAHRGQFRIFLELEVLSVANSDLNSLDFTGQWNLLRELDISSTQVADLAPLAKLTNLQHLDCWSTQINDLAPIAKLTNLQHLVCSSTQVKDLVPLAKLTNLQHLVCSSTQVKDLVPLAKLTNLQHLDCWSTQINDLAPIAKLTNLQHLVCSSTQVKDLVPLAKLTNLQHLVCSSTQVKDLVPLAKLTNLQHLDCWSTQINDLAPIAKLTNLQHLDCSFTQVNDLAPIAKLTNLQHLDCSSTQVNDLAPIAKLTNLQHLVCSSTQVKDLVPLAKLTNLQHLVCRFTQVNDLAPIAKLTNLQHLDCRFTQVNDLAHLAKLTNLQHLDCSSTQVNDLAPLAKLTNLQHLDCWSTQVNDLAHLAKLTNLQHLDCSRCRLNAIPSAIRGLASLDTLIAFETHVPNLPHGVLSQSPVENCLDAMRAHFADLAAQAVDLTDVKLLILGNGGVGKTQIARWFSGEPFDPDWDSTHGIRVVGKPKPDSVAATCHLQMWDFGGQDIYHGTHALFLRGPAVLMPAWAKDRENADHYEHEGLTFRNHPLTYWVDVVRHQTSADNPVLLVQTKCDRQEDKARRFPVPEDALHERPFVEELAVSPKTGMGRAHLEDTLGRAVAWMREPDRLGLPQIGAGRLRVQRRLEALRETDMALPREQRRHRLMERADFDAICAEEGGVSSPGLLLDYLDANGAIFYRAGLFGDRIVLDQGWALDAIYAVFDRKKVFKMLRARGGRFTRGELGLLVWQEQSDEEQELLVGMMRSCGMCFVHRRFGDAEDTEYIAPDLLPDRAALVDPLASRWDHERPSEVATFHHALLHGGLIRSIMAAIGEMAAADALYWRGGLCAYETNTRSRLLIEEVMLAGEWRGAIRVSTQDGQAAALLDKACGVVERVQAQLGMKPISIKRTITLRDTAKITDHWDVQIVKAHPSVDESLNKSMPAKDQTLTFGQDKPKTPEWFVSYAWRDKTPAGRKREAIVDKLCAAAKADGRVIERDKEVLNLGDSISAFMRRIGTGDRIFVVLSEKYLRSTSCMFELSEVWRSSGQDKDIFLARVRIYRLPDAKIWAGEDQRRWAIHWKREHDKIDAEVREHGHGFLGEAGHREWILMQRFYMQVADILAALADIVQPRTFKELERYGFQDHPK